MKVFKVNGIAIEEDTFMRKIIETLDTAKFATCEQVSMILKARVVDVSEVMDNIIVWYVKNNPGVSYNKLCLDLSIKSEYVDKLILEGRIEDQSEFAQARKELLSIEASSSEITNQFIKDMKRREAIKGLSQQISQKENPIVKTKTVNKFFTNPSDYTRRR